MILTDIAIEHVYQGRKASAPMTFTLHPFAAPEGEHAGRFELMLSLRGKGEEQVRSGWVTLDELAELYARELMAKRGLRLRLRPLEDGVYPDSYPGKKVPRSCIVPGSDFERRVRAVDRARPVSAGLRAQLALWDAPPEAEA